MQPDSTYHPPDHRARVPIVLAVEGLCFAGKTTLAQALATQRQAVAIPEYADLAALPPWPPHNHEDVVVTLHHFLHLEQQRATLARRTSSRLVVLDRSPLSLIAHEFGMDHLGVPAAPNLAAHLFAEAAERGIILTPDAYVYLRVPASVSAARQAHRGPVAAHLIDPRTQAGIETVSYSYLDAVPPQRRLVLDGTAQVGPGPHGRPAPGRPSGPRRADHAKLAGTRWCRTPPVRRRVEHVVGTSRAHYGEAAVRTAVATLCPDFRAHGQAERTETSLLIPGVLNSRKVIAKCPIDRRPFWLARAHHEITVYRTLPALAPLPVTVPELVAADPTHHLIIMTHLAGRPVHPHRYPRATIHPGQLNAVLDLLSRVHAWRPALPSALPYDDDYPLQLAAVRSSEINDVDYHHAVELSTAITGRLGEEIQHGDAHLGNVIQLPNHQLALIDLEFTAWRLPGYDLAKLWILLGDTPSARRQLTTRIGSTIDRHAAFWCAALLVCLREITSHRRAPLVATHRTRLRRLLRDLALTLDCVQAYHRRIA